VLVATTSCKYQLSAAGVMKSISNWLIFSCFRINLSCPIVSLKNFTKLVRWRFLTLKQRNRLVPLSSAVLSCLFTTWMWWKGTVSVSVIPVGIPHVYISSVSLSFDLVRLCATYMYSYVVYQTFLLVIPTSCSVHTSSSRLRAFRSTCI